MTLRVKIQKNFAGFSLDIAWEVNKEIGVLFGASGAGKSLTLQLVAGLMTPDSGSIHTDNHVFYDSAAWVNNPAQKSRLGYVFNDT